MPDSGANVLVIPWKPGMKGEKTMCTLVGDNKTEGLIVSKLYTHSRVNLIVAVKEALVLLPISYLVRIANYQVAWKLVLDKDQFLMTDNWGDQVPVTEQEDLTFLSKSTFWRVGPHAESVDFVDLFNPGNFTARGNDLNPGLVVDMTHIMSVDPEKDMRVEAYRAEARHDIEQQDPMIVLAAPPCTGFSAIQNINRKHQNTQEWSGKYEEAMMLLQFSVGIYWDQISRGKFFLHEHPATAASWDCPFIKELAQHPGVYVVIGDMCRCGMHLDEDKENQGTESAVLVKKPTKWMTNSLVLANLLSVR